MFPATKSMNNMQLNSDLLCLDRLNDNKQDQMHNLYYEILPNPKFSLLLGD